MERLMTKRLMTTTALGLALVVTPALADSQQNTNTTDMRSKPSQTQPMKQGASQAGEKAGEQINEMPNTDTTSNVRRTENNRFLLKQSNEHQLATALIGKPVYNGENEEIGEISDLVTTDDGQVRAAIIGVGGFLGLGEKDVALSYNAINVSRGENEEIRVVANVTEEALDTAPDYKTLEEQQTAENRYVGETPKPGAKKNPNQTN